MNEGIRLMEPRRLIAPWERERIFEVVSVPATKEEAKEEHLKFLETFDGINIYTDGSKRWNEAAAQKTTGAGYSLRRKGLEQAIGGMVINDRPEFNQVFHGELNGAKGGMQRARIALEMRQPGEGRPSWALHIDSQSAIKALAKPAVWASNDPLTLAKEEAKRAKRHLAQEGKTLQLRWVPGHDDEIEGNKEADVQAGEATKLATRLPDGTMTVMDEAEERAWKTAREATHVSKTMKTLGLQLNKLRGREFRNPKKMLTPEQGRRRIRWQMGRVFSRIQGKTCKNCIECGTSMQDQSPEAHLLLHCVKTKNERRQFKIEKGARSPNDWLLQCEKFDQFLVALDKKVVNAKAETEEQIRLPNDSQDVAGAAILTPLELATVRALAEAAEHPAAIDEEDDDE